MHSVLRSLPLVAVFTLAASDVSAGAFARFVHPTDGARVMSPVAFRWTAADKAEGYVLSIGTSPGGSDLLTSEESQALEHRPINLPAGRPLYARIWTRAGRTRRYHDVRFAVPAAQEAVLYDRATGKYSLELAAGRDGSVRGTWGKDERVLTADFNADGLADVFRYAPATGAWWRYLGLGDGTFRESAGQWAPGWHTASADFNGDRRTDLFLYNANSGAWLACLSTSIEGFTYVAGAWAPGWRIHVADFNADGRDDLFLFGNVPASPTSGRWRVMLASGGSGFTPAASGQGWRPSVEIVPSDFNGDRRADVLRYDAESGRWSLAINAESGVIHSHGSWPAHCQVHTLDLNGDGRVDVLLYDRRSGRWVKAITSKAGRFSYTYGRWAAGWDVRPAMLNGDARADLFLYKPETGRWRRALSRRSGRFQYQSGAWKAAYSTIALAGVPFTSPVAIPTNPVAGGSFDAGDAFGWTESPWARAYRLQIGSQPGASDLHDSQPLAVTRRFVRGLPEGVRLHARLSTKIGDQWSPFDFTFTVSHGPGRPSIDTEIAEALKVTAAVRRMASRQNAPFGWTSLFERTSGAAANCFDYATILSRALAGLNLDVPFRTVNIGFIVNGFDTHTLVEIEDPRSGEWALLDPTFALTVRRASDRRFATTADLSRAARTQRWADVVFVPLTGAGFQYARDYYLDYPLLFLNVLEGSGITKDPASVLPYLRPVTAPIPPQPALYLVKSTGTSATVLVDGAPRTLPLSERDRVSQVFWASALAVASPSRDPVQMYTPRRFVF